MAIYSLDILLSQVWNQSLVPRPVLTVVSRSANRFFKSLARWSCSPISKNFPQFVVFHTVEGFSIVNGAEYLRAKCINIFIVKNGGISRLTQLNILLL